MASGLLREAGAVLADFLIVPFVPFVFHCSWRGAAALCAGNRIVEWRESMNLRGSCILSFLALALACGCSSSKSGLPAESGRPQEIRIAVPKTEGTAAEKAEKMMHRGKRQYENGLLASAQRTLEKAVEIDPTNLKAWYYLHLVQETIVEQERKEQSRREFLRMWESI
jgi:hypothetical protein